MVKRPTRHKAFLSSCTLDIQDKTVCRELLVTFNSQNVPRLDISPSDWQEPLDLPRDHQVLNLLVVDLVRDFPLSEFKSKITDAHQAQVDTQCHDWKAYINLVIFLRIQNQEK